jgi:DNA polymerase-3 subunit alpha
LRVAVNGSVPPVADVLRDFPSRRIATEQGDLPQGLTVRLQLDREAASAELDLGDEARFYPTDAALDRWRAGAHRGQAVVVYE